MSLDGQLERLSALYDEKSNDELLAMYDDRDDLTEVAQQALAQTMRGRNLVERASPAISDGAAEVEAEPNASEAALWTFGDAFEAREAIRLLNEAGIWQRVGGYDTDTEGIRNRAAMGLTLIVRAADSQAAVELLRAKMGLFPLPENGSDEGSPLSVMREVVLLSMLDRHDGLIAAQALGGAGISYYWRDGQDESQELPDEQTVAIEVRGEDFERAAEAVEKVLPGVKLQE